MRNKPPAGLARLLFDLLSSDWSEFGLEKKLKEENGSLQNVLG